VQELVLEQQDKSGKVESQAEKQMKVIAAYKDVENSISVINLDYMQRGIAVNITIGQINTDYKCSWALICNVDEPYILLTTDSVSDLYQAFFANNGLMKAINAIDIQWQKKQKQLIEENTELKDKLNTIDHLHALDKRLDRKNEEIDKLNQLLSEARAKIVGLEEKVKELANGTLDFVVGIAKANIAEERVVFNTGGNLNSGGGGSHATEYVGGGGTSIYQGGAIDTSITGKAPDLK
jgi:hypothetical protein